MARLSIQLQYIRKILIFKSKTNKTLNICNFFITAYQQHICLQMQSIDQLQKQVEVLQDQINDIFHSTRLNFKALQLQILSNGQNHLAQKSLAQSIKDFQYLQELYKERGNLRLQYLITQQIKQQEAKVRRQRLVQYQQKICDQRRLISDKQAFYQTLLKPRKKRPASMSVQQFQQQKKQQLANEQKKNIKYLQIQTQQLNKMYQVIKKQNEKLKMIQKQLQQNNISEQQQKHIINALQKNPNIYDSLKQIKPLPVSQQQIIQLCNQIVEIDKNNKQILQQYQQQKELYQYLCWQHRQLIKQYRQLDQSRKKQYAKYLNSNNKSSVKLQRACSL